MTFRGKPAYIFGPNTTAKTAASFNNTAISRETGVLELTLGYSPCPNDTFIFHALVKGLLDTGGLRFRERLHDVEALNRMAMEAKLDITKLSFHAWLHVRQTYTLLDSGAALGYGCGPVVIARRPMARGDLAAARIVFPGRWTTAHLLFGLWAPEARDRLFTTYDRIFGMLDAGEAEAGVIIHENRFTFRQAGFTEIVDLGVWWEAETGLPIPLGCIAARRNLPDGLAGRVESLIRESIRRAAERPDEAMPYMRAHAQEMDADVLRRHVETFVNEFSLALGDRGRQAVDVLAQRAREAGMVP